MASSDIKIDPRDINTPDDWIERHPELIRLTGRHPFNCEPPLEHLKTFVTPTELHYVRNHGAVPRLDWDSHEIRVDGLVGRSISLSMQGLVSRFQQHEVEIPVLLVCAGNRRMEQNMIKKSIGFSWGSGAASTALWTGIPLHVLLSYCGIDRSKARYVWFEGADALPHENYGTCIPVHTAMDPSCDVLIAWKMNGKMLAPDHGFPVRMIIPGHIGGRMVKWLARIHVSDIESTNHHHLHDNRVLPSHVDAVTATAENWWAKPAYVIMELNINAVVFTPGHTDELVLNNHNDSEADCDMYTVRGYAYSGGGRRVTRVEITLDDGTTWRLGDISYEEQPNAFGKMWCWVQYSVQVSVAELCQAQEICVRAWDASMNTMPEFPTWNVMGMMNNPWFRVRIHRQSRPNGRDVLVFEHPTQLGKLKGGWMTKDAIPRSNDARRFLKSAQMAAAIEEEDATPKINVDLNQDLLDGLPWFTQEEVSQHATKESCWFICRDLVYDATPFLSEHPGGATSILLCGGTDCTDEFESIHSTKAWQMLAKYVIGRCKSNSSETASTASVSDESEDLEDGPRLALNGPQQLPLVLVGKQHVSHDSRIFRFALPAKDMRLGLPVGNHVFLYATIRGKKIVRAYTPISSNNAEDAGFVCFLIKVYFAGANPAHPEGGLFSQHLDDLHLGSNITMKGPLGHFTYHSLGSYSLESDLFQAKKFGFVAGGTGITPVYQIMRAILEDPEDETQIAVVYSVRSEKDLLLREELEQLQKLKPEQCRIFFTVTDQVSNDWHYGTRRVCLEMLQEVIGSDADHIAMCGPPGLLEHTCVPAFESLGYNPATQLTLL